MSNKFLHKTYTDEQIQQYVSGKLSNDEMHEFEKYIANDPMLADALEGFLNNNDTISTQIIAEIRGRISRINKKTKIVELIKNWGAVAAVFVSVLFAIAYFLLPAKQVNTSFVKDIKEKTVNNTNATTVTDESDFVKQDTNTRTSATEKLTINKKQGKIVDTNQLFIENIQDNFAENKISKEIKHFNLNGFEIKGKITDQKGHPIPSVNIFTKGKLINIQSNSLGQFSFQSLDSIVEVVMEKQGFLKKTIKLHANNNKVALLRKRG